MIPRSLSVLTTLLIVGCSAMPGSTSTGPTDTSVILGNNAVGERCTQQADSVRSAAIYCGNWEQPSALVTSGGPADAGSLIALATSSAWRNDLDHRFLCGPPTPTMLLGPQPTVVLQCTRRIGGWPQIAFASMLDGTVWYLDGVNASLPVMQRSLAVMTGRSSGEGLVTTLAGADAQLATHLAAQATKSGDIGQYEALMTAGTRANLADSPAAAEQAYRAALELQQKAMGANNPNTADPTMLLALQLSNQGQYAAASALFDRVDQLVQRSSDSAAAARLLHYRGLHELNQNHGESALAMLNEAEAAYDQLLPLDVLSGRGQGARRLVSNGNLAEMMPDPTLLVDPVVQSSLLGVIEVRRNKAIALKLLDRTVEAQASLDSAAALARANNVDQPIVTSRLYRTEGMLGGTLSGLGPLSSAADSFTRALPGSRSYAITRLLQAGKLVEGGDTADALPVCRESLKLLGELRAGTDAGTLMPCLDAFAAEALKHTAQADELRAEMFLVAQAAQGGVTIQQIAKASARLQENGRDPKVADAIRRQQDAALILADLYRQRSEQAAAVTPVRGKAAILTQTAPDLGAKIVTAERNLQDADSALEAASPRYGQLVQEVVPASTVLGALRPDEAFASTVLADKEGWTFLLRDGHISVGYINGGQKRVAALVKRLRATVEATNSGKPPAFDIEASQDLYKTVLSSVAGSMDGTKSLIVAPSGPLLSVPFALLLTGPAAGGSLADAPWLIRTMAVSHVPAPANFVTLRKAAEISRATKPWFGLGNFQPIPLAEARAVFPGATCSNSAQLLSSLQRLPFAGIELDAARNLLGASKSDELVGSAYTTDAVMQAALRDYHVLHFASHALLPSELRCEDQAAIVTSVGTRNSADPLLTADKVQGLKLDADTVILSACNSGGPGGSTGGESLSGLARAFFYAGARSMLVTHWSVNDQTSALLVIDTLNRLQKTKALSITEALRQAQLSLLSDSSGLTAHPFYWAAFALIGEGNITDPASHSGSRPERS